MINVNLLIADRIRQLHSESTRLVVRSKLVAMGFVEDPVLAEGSNNAGYMPKWGCSEDIKNPQAPTLGVFIKFVILNDGNWLLLRLDSQDRNGDFKGEQQFKYYIPDIVIDGQIWAEIEANIKELINTSTYVRVNNSTCVRERKKKD
jgi:hypothetical protein